MIRLRPRHTGLFLAAVLAWPACQGCDDGKPAVDSSKSEATVSGTVRVRGKPAEGGTIVFSASNSERIVPPRSAPISKDGTYQLTTFTGGNQVLFEGDVAVKNREIGLIREYVDVKRGQNTHDFDLLGEGGKESPFPVPTKREPATAKAKPKS
jgi:hypothetical protein